jgi:hypothetical protein
VIYFERNCGLFGDSLYYGQQGDRQGRSKQKVIFQDLTPITFATVSKVIGKAEANKK